MTWPHLLSALGFLVCGFALGWTYRIPEVAALQRSLAHASTDAETARQMLAAYERRSSEALNQHHRDIGHLQHLNKQLLEKLENSQARARRLARKQQT